MARFDLFTVLILNSIITFIFSVFLMYYVRFSKDKFKGMKCISYGFLGYSIGILLLTMREYLPLQLYLSVLLGNVISFIGIISLNVGLKRMFKIKFNHKIYIIVFLFFVCVFYYFTVITPNVSFRILLISAAISLLFFDTTLALFRKSRRDNEMNYNALIIILFVYVLVNSGRAVLAVINYNSINVFLEYSSDIIFHILGIVTLFSIFMDVILIINKILSNEIEDRLKENQNLVAKLEHLTNVDYLTSVHNRKSLEAKTKELIESCSNSNRTFKYIFIDLNDFKAFNDKFGHPFGDKVLINFSKILSKHANCVYRFGGDEFIVLVDDESIDPKTLVERIKAQCKTCKNELDYKPTFSYGVHQWTHGETYADILHKVDQMMYVNKRTIKSI